MNSPSYVKHNASHPWKMMAEMSARTKVEIFKSLSLKTGHRCIHHFAMYLISSPVVKIRK
jgi:hypothetical protein